MKRYLRVLALGAFFVPAAILAGCGEEGIPGNAVAEVDGTAIEKADFEHWLDIAAKSSGQPDAVVPKPPEFTECIAQAKKAAAKPAEGQPKQTDADYKKQCQQQYDQLREQVLGLLISFEWIEREAEEQGVKVTDAEVKKSFEEQKKQSYPKDADFKKFLEQSGYTNEDLLMRVRLDVLSNKIRDKVTKGKDKVSDAQVEEVLRQEPAAVRAARAARPEHRADQDEGQGRGGQGGAGVGAAVQAGRQAVLRTTTPRRPRAASCRRSPRVSRRRRSTLRSSTPRRARSPARSRRSSATTSSRSTRSVPPRSRRSSRRRRRSSRCSPRRTSRRRSTRSSRTSARSGRGRPSAARAT